VTGRWRLRVEVETIYGFVTWVGQYATGLLDPAAAGPLPANHQSPITNHLRASPLAQRML